METHSDRDVAVWSKTIREEKNRKSVERSMQPPKKRTGRMVMHRSRPPRKKVDVEVDEVNDDDKYLT